MFLFVWFETGEDPDPETDPEPDPDPCDQIITDRADLDLEHWFSQINIVSDASFDFMC